MFQRAISFRIPAAQREVLAAREPVQSNSLSRYAHPCEAAEELFGLKISGTKFEAGGDVLPADMYDAVEPCLVPRPDH
jgi:hypothetical protein